MNHNDLWRRQRISEMTAKAESLGISYEEYCIHLRSAEASQRQWLKDLAAVGWDHSKSPLENLRRLNAPTVRSV